MLSKVEEGKDLEFEMYLTRRPLDFFYSFDGCERCKTVKVKEVKKVTALIIKFYLDWRYHFPITLAD